MAVCTREEKFLRLLRLVRLKGSQSLMINGHPSGFLLPIRKRAAQFVNDGDLLAALHLQLADKAGAELIADLARTSSLIRMFVPQVLFRDSKRADRFTASPIIV